MPRSRSNRASLPASGRSSPALKSSSSSAKTSAGVPFRTSSPLFITSTLPAYSARLSMLCEIIKIVMPTSFRLRVSCIKLSRPIGSSPAMGSSMMRIEGSIASTPAIATLRFCPPESEKRLIFIKVVIDAHMLQRHPHPVYNLALGYAHLARAKGHVLFHCLFKQLIFRVLKHHPHRVAQLFFIGLFWSGNPRR